MFNWTTTTIINSLKDFSTGADLVKVWTDAENGENDLKAGFSGQYPVIKIKRDHTFEARYISKIYKATGYNPQLCSMTIDCTKFLGIVPEDLKVNAFRPAHLRLSFYVTLEGSEESIYANDWYQKGKPFSVGFDVTDLADAAGIAKKIKRNVEKFGVAMYGKKVFDLVDDGNGKLVLNGTHEYQRFKVATVTLDHGVHEHLLDIYEDGQDVSENEVFTLEARGLNGFGTFHQLAKDLRLPTVHNTKWLKVKADETPVVGGIYDQYIVTYCAPSMANPGFTVVGQHNMSVTTHVFWVLQGEVSDEFAGYLKQVYTIEEVNTVTSATDDAEESVELTLKEEGGKDYAANHELKLVHAEADSELTKVSKDSL